MGDNTLPDQVAGMKELAERYPWIDIDRAGIYGHSGGGYATCDAMFRYPLIKANKDFDLILFPNRGHGFGNEPYMVRRRWDYFVRHLLGVEPPKEYELKPPAKPPNPMM